MSLITLITKPTSDYELLDSGDGEKLERYGSFVLARPDPQALWHKRLPVNQWANASGIFTREERNAGWALKSGTPRQWPMHLGGLTMMIRPSSFKHTGLFPEQELNWDWMRGLIRDNANTANREKRLISVLNLFGYTGGATLAAAQAGASVCHVDGSKVAVAWGRENAVASGLDQKPIRWIVEDVALFVRREIKRGHKYDGIILDPPSFGHGPNKELWKIEEHLLPLLDLCRSVLSDQPLFILLNGYAAGYSPYAYQNSLAGMMEDVSGEIEAGELTIQESRLHQDFRRRQGFGGQVGGQAHSDRLLPCGMFARWRSGS